MYWIQNNQYHEGDPLPGDVACPQRPAGYDTFSNGVWSQSAGAQRLATFQSAITAGYDTGLGWKLPLDDASRSLITSDAALLASYLVTASSSGASTFLAANTTVIDDTGTPHTVTNQQALTTYIAYGQYYRQIWAAAQ